ncbi:bifunctional demethylmenaquinone methyltransferase/2-methoxy-6-polyprenyl-1,4-benzoquinol methylase UbiE [Geminicoccus flavidas]|uniref:bifunctional demethylmenaquinone methyltransferase/2-methoxy-6-polyprenyl-1,4-benzoquinol methylase UbiE n=1 Tax=Geminicoccus flavidas TaxID=2506407 RepID=UPI001357689F|nr:bifunctional demethylmenaquinone methyltransferase/2-methoxy-6-polyprenyl-1,4-benzoquinol methylase UbiE [Geminicoccus flavidas]
MKDAADELARSFGYEKVDPAEKATKVRQVFDRVAARYDLMNDLMSGGVHRLWKDALVDWLAPRKGITHLDVAGGTGDVAFRIMDRVGGEAGITVCDINHAMLEVGRDRAIDRGLVHGLSWVTGDAMALPFKDKSVDSYTIAFGIRNVTRIDRALGEAYRVLKPGGRFLCLEFSRLIIPQLRPIYDQYSLRMIPVMGKLVANDAESYRYLVESIRRFPDQKTFARLIGRAGFGLVKLRNLSGGIAAVHSGWRL